MTYAEVVEVLGREGTLDSRTVGSDVPVVTSYYWWNANSSYIEATFEKDRLVYKHQARLRAPDKREQPVQETQGSPAPSSAIRVVAGVSLVMCLAGSLVAYFAGLPFPRGTSWLTNGIINIFVILGIIFFFMAMDCFARYRGTKSSMGIPPVVWLISGINGLILVFYMILAGPVW